LWHIDLKRITKGYSGYKDRAVTAGFYGAHHIDSLGDQNHTALSDREAWMYDEVLKHDKNPETYSKQYVKDALSWYYLEQFVDWCRRENVQVLFVPSTLMWHESYRSDSREAEFYVQIPKEVRKRGWTYVGEPYDFMYDKSLYLNTNYHLIDEGRKMHTQKLIDILQGQIRVH